MPCGKSLMPVSRASITSCEGPSTSRKACRSLTRLSGLGGGEKVTLKLVAKYGDACNIGGIDTEVYRHKFDVLKQHCEDVGRDYNSIIKSAEVFTHLVLPGQTAEQATAKQRRDVGKLAGHEVGVEEFQQGKYRGYPQSFIGTPREAIDVFSRIIDAGVDYIIVY